MDIMSFRIEGHADRTQYIVDVSHEKSLDRLHHRPEYMVKELRELIF